MIIPLKAREELHTDLPLLLCIDRTAKPATVSAVESAKPNPMAVDQSSSPRISFSGEFLDEKDFISITPNSLAPAREEKRERQREKDFEFLSNKASCHSMLSADELFFEGKLLPFWRVEQEEKLNKISLNGKNVDGEEAAESEKEETKLNWFIDDDPSPRPPKCTVLWKELLRLKKQRASSLLPSSSSSSSSSSSVSDTVAPGQGKEGLKNKEKQVKRIKKGLERTRSASIRIRPMINVPICTQVKTSALPPRFSLKKVRTERSETSS